MNLKAAINGIKQKDETAFEFIYNSTSSSVYGIIKAIIKDHNKTEDVMQETYIKMIKSINSYNYKYNFKSWLLTIARNTALDYYRKIIKEEVIDVNENEHLFPKQKIVVGYAITGIQLVGNYSYEVQTLNYNKQITTINKQKQKEISNEMIDEFHKYFYFVEDYLELYNVDIEIYVNEENDYEYKMIVKVEKLFNVFDEYILYYDEKREIDDDEEEKEMKGILIYQNITYNFKSEEELEEGESEIKVIIYEENYNNRVEIEKEVEIDEYQYEYTIYKDNKKHEVVELEVEEGKIELVIEKEDAEHEYTITKINNNNFLITYDDDYIFNLFTDLNEKQYVYEYENEQIIKK